MSPQKIVLFLILCGSLYSCTDKHPAKEKQIVKVPEEMDKHVAENLGPVLQYAADNSGMINDSIGLHVVPIVRAFYRENEFHNIWSSNEKWLPLADSLYLIIQHAELYGLFPSDYHYNSLQQIHHQLASDTMAKMDANLWTKADLMLTDGFMEIAKHVKEGRLLPDTISLSSDTTLTDSFFIKNLNTAIKNNNITSILNALEPKHHGYIELKNSIGWFLDSMAKKTYTYVPYPSRDSVALMRILKKRLLEGSWIDSFSKRPDSAVIAEGLKKLQKSKQLTADGKIGVATARYLNTSDVERFKRIAITLDRYKQLPAVLPEKYIWVNLPGYYLQVWDDDTIALQSKVIVGKPTTRTPTLNSEITDMVTYPQWTIPNSIIKKDILPALKKNPGYLARKGFSLVSDKGETIDPFSVNWAKYSKGIPYKIVQGSGDDNALGVLKFNFNNPYSVYLHDTNQRYLFKNAARALSHGCVRVQEWEKLAFYIARNDSLNAKANTTLKYTADSIKNWLSAKVRKRILVQKKIPLFIRYFTCEGKDGKVIFYDDIYGEDKSLRDKYFANK